MTSPTWKVDLQRNLKRIPWGQKERAQWECVVQSHTYIHTNAYLYTYAWKESYGKLDSILKSRDILLPTNVHLVKAMVFPVVMYGCESWTIKKVEY